MFSWGAQEKVYIASEDSIKVFQCSQREIEIEDKKYFEYLDEIYVEGIDDRSIISAGIAHFGTIIEFSDFLSIIRSDNTQIKIPSEEVVRWRTFNQTKEYSSNLCLIDEDSLEIHSFNHDYSLDQDEKVSGIRYGKQ